MVRICKHMAATSPHIQQTGYINADLLVSGVSEYESPPPTMFRHIYETFKSPLKVGPPDAMPRCISSHKRSSLHRPSCTFVSVCVYVRTLCACAHIYGRACMRARVRACMRACVYACVYVSVRICLLACVCIIACACARMGVRACVQHIATFASMQVTAFAEDMALELRHSTEHDVRRQEKKAIVGSVVTVVRYILVIQVE